ERQRGLVVVDLEARDAKLQATPLAPHAPAEDEVEPGVELLLEPRLVEPDGAEALAGGAFQVGPQHVQPAAAVAGAAAQDPARHGGVLTVLERRQAGQD